MYTVHLKPISRAPSHPSIPKGDRGSTLNARSATRPRRLNEKGRGQHFPAEKRGALFALPSRAKEEGQEPPADFLKPESRGEHGT